MSITWAELCKNKDQDIAFSRISSLLKSIDKRFISHADLAQIMLSGCFNCIDYNDPSDIFADFENQDEGRPRKIRLSNFMDYLSEYTNRRLSLRHDNDNYISRQSGIFNATGALKEDDISGAAEFDDIMTTIEHLTADMVAEGLGRLGIAKAYADAAFIMASQEGVSFYEEFAAYILQSLDPDSETLHKIFESENTRSHTGASMLAGSSSIH